MTTIAVSAAPRTQRARRAGGIAGLAYIGIWVTGLTAFGTGPGPNASGAEVARYFADHRLTTAAQGMLVHGLAALALYVVLNRVAHASTPASHTAGVVGVGVSMVQLALDLWRSLVATGSTTAQLVEIIDRLDGLKMFAFAMMIGASIPAFRSAGLVGSRMAITGRAATAALTISGVGYVGAFAPLAGTAAVSLVLLLLWVAYVGVAADRRRI